jgi:hypothetical protein
VTEGSPSRRTKSARGRGVEVVYEAPVIAVAEVVMTTEMHQKIESQNSVETKYSSTFTF